MAGFALDERYYWLGLTLMQGIGSIRIKQLLSFFGSAEKAWHAHEADLRKSGLPDATRQKFLQQRQKLDLSAEVLKIQKIGASLLTLADKEYPRALRNLEDAPPVLYMRGQLVPEDELALAVVGTRNATRYGRDSAHYLSKQLASQHVTIVSGLAQGIDSAAHQGALDAEGRTLAVLGCGIDRIYPRENEPLAKKILHHGAILSEHPIGTPPSAANFPRRNRLLSGLARGVLIVEAPEHSGALITATAALEQGRDVFAVPGNIFSTASRGTNRLIQDGAKLVMNVQDILSELNIQYTKRETRQKAQQIAPENPVENAILQLLDADPIHIDDLIRSSGLSAGDVTATLTILELKGLAQTAGPMQYCRSR